ncbi:hypothetical protein HOS86_gp124 [Klebsiella phage vB_KpnM_KpS110]|uniref:DUF7425 domain-containing protein n=1 Tax=Klebsiella phage vB_KpnM_KpS110 TaxID=2079262 RepID=A0A2K9VAQ7_9CAUD|nr:hypothetical protein HOS86_gp124 [Klebsiella phage vB_KpnM_KpS110]AUV59298.1 hypothetical protein kps110_182 [Klebsiella phage vB_KpnM_KpS110]
MAHIWCDVLLVLYTTARNDKTNSAFFPVPFSSGGMTVARILEIEKQLGQPTMFSQVQVVGYELLNEMLIPEVSVERVITNRSTMAQLIEGNKNA